jgi:hypothetical protein
VVEQQVKELRDEFNSELQVTRRDIRMARQDIDVARKDIEVTRYDLEATGQEFETQLALDARTRHKGRDVETNVFGSTPPPVEGRG